MKTTNVMYKDQCYDHPVEVTSHHVVHKTRWTKEDCPYCEIGKLKGEIEVLNSSLRHKNEYNATMGLQVNRLQTLLNEHHSNGASALPEIAPPDRKPAILKDIQFIPGWIGPEIELEWDNDRFQRVRLSGPAAYPEFLIPALVDLIHLLRNESLNGHI